MGGGTLVMNQRERCRLVIMSRVRDRAMTIREAEDKLPSRLADIQAI